MTDWKPYLLALAVGLLAGLLYGLLNVRSPAPPVVALVGLLGILVGEQLPPLVKRVLAGEPVDAAWAREECIPHVLGPLPGDACDASQRGGGA
jgi:XapX domain-containing protein